MGLEGKPKNLNTTDEVIAALDRGEISQGNKGVRNELPNNDVVTIDVETNQITYQFSDGMILKSELANGNMVNSNLLDNEGNPVQDRENIRVRVQSAQNALEQNKIL